mmetsp:Transcript_38511/g.66092  ORF Transcript_38511/g.66092 Transcript_38511/m.66092 type:complete len:205 (+) Transcript_38511:214-828(+)
MHLSHLSPLPLLLLLLLLCLRRLAALPAQVESARDDRVGRELETVVDAPEVTVDLVEKVDDHDSHRHGQRRIELHPSVEEGGDHEEDDAAGEAGEREAVVDHHAVHRVVHRSIRPAQGEAGTEDGAEGRVDNREELEAHDERRHDQVQGLRVRVGVLVERDLRQTVPREAGKEGRRRADGKTVVCVVQQLPLSNLQHLYLERGS